MVKGLLLIMNFNCCGDLQGIGHIFLPTTNKQKATEYAKGNGDLIGMIPYHVSVNELSDEEKACILERLSYLGEL